MFREVCLSGPPLAVLLPPLHPYLEQGEEIWVCSLMKAAYVQKRVCAVSPHSHTPLQIFLSICPRWLLGSDPEDSSPFLF